MLITMGCDDLSAIDISYAVEQRLRFIELLLDHYGYFKRRSVVEFFGVSPRSVSRDIQIYQGLAPGNVFYNAQAKAFQKAEGFERRYS